MREVGSASLDVLADPTPTPPAPTPAPPPSSHAPSTGEEAAALLPPLAAVLLAPVSVGEAGTSATEALLLLWPWWPLPAPWAAAARRPLEAEGGGAESSRMR